MHKKFGISENISFTVIDKTTGEEIFKSDGRNITQEEIDYIKNKGGNRMYLEQRVEELEKQLSVALNEIEKLKDKKTADKVATEFIGAFKNYVKENLHKSNNQLRKEIIQKAKGFVKEHTKDKNIKFEVDYANRVIKAYSTNITTIGCFTYKITDKMVYGHSKCLDCDVFNVHIGKAIALGKLLKIDVSEFYNVNQPDEFVVGQKVKHMFIKENSEFEVYKLEENKIYEKDGTWSFTGNCKIIDDSNAKFY